MINTLNETHLHRTLKTLYQAQNPESTTETQVGKSIADIVTKDGNIIEIQTGSLAHLKEKCRAFLANGRTVTIVYPLATVKYIETYTQDGTLLRRRKSPQKKPLYTMFRELTGLCSILTEPKLSVHVLETIIAEERIQTESPVQSANGRRRTPKNWLKTGKRLESIERTSIFASPADYVSLLPRGMPDIFCAKDVYTRLKAQGASLTQNDARLMLWVLSHAGIIFECEKKGKTRQYTLCQKISV